MLPPQRGIGLELKISSDCRRNCRIQSGSLFMSEIWLTISGIQSLVGFENGFRFGAKIVLVDFGAERMDRELR